MSNFGIDYLKQALKNMPFFENELAYLSINGHSETTFRDRLGYYLANENHKEGTEKWNVFFPKETDVQKKMDLVVIEGQGSDITDRIVSIIEFKHRFLTQIIYGNELRGKKHDSGTKMQILNDIYSRLKIVKDIKLDKQRNVTQYQVLFISHYVPTEEYHAVPNRQEIYTHSVAKFLHVKGEKSGSENGLVRKSNELLERYPDFVENGIFHDGIMHKIKIELEYVFRNQEQFNVKVEVGRLGNDEEIHKYHYFNAKTYFAIMEIIPNG